MPGHPLLLFGTSLPLSAPRHRHKKKRESQLPVRPQTVPSVLVYLVSFVKALRNAALSLPLELVQTLFELSTRTFFLRIRLCIPCSPSTSLHLVLPSTTLPSSSPVPMPAETMVPAVVGQGWWLVALSQPTLLPRGRCFGCCPFPRRARSCPQPPIADSLRAS